MLKIEIVHEDIQLFQLCVRLHRGLSVCVSSRKHKWTSLTENTEGASAAQSARVCQVTLLYQDQDWTWRCIYTVWWNLLQCSSQTLWTLMVCGPSVCRPYVLTLDEAADLRGAAGPSACSLSTFGAAETQNTSQTGDMRTFRCRFNKPWQMCVSVRASYRQQLCFFCAADL